MGALRNAWATITRQLGNLNGKDKALIGSLVAVGVLALVLVALWSSKPNMVQLLPDMGPGDQAAAQTTLSEADIEHETRGGKVYVMPDKRMQALAYLQQAGKMPQDTQSLFAALAKSSNWMQSSRDSERLANAALCDVLSGVIGSFKGVERATVMIDAPETIGYGTAARKPTASVGVLMKSGQVLDRSMVDAIAAMVSGAKAGLAMEDVRVIDQRGGQQYTPRGTNSVGGSGLAVGDNYLDLAMKHEDQIQRKVSAVVGRIDPLSIVTVSVQVDNTVKRTTTETYLKDGAGSVSIPESTTNDETTDRSSDGAGGGSGSPAAPGVTSNVPADINNGSGGAGSASKKESSTVKSKVGLGNKKEDQIAPGGMATRISVMVSLSREYMINLIKTKKGPAAAPAANGAADAPAANDDPTQAQIDEAFLAEKRRLEADLKPVVQTAAVEPNDSNIPRVTVSLLPVMQTGLAGIGFGGGGSGMASSGGASAGGLMGQLASGQTIRTAFLGLLAFIALGMMLMLVRKSSKPQNLPSPEELAGLPPVMEIGEDVVGEADEGATAMVGIELGETQIKTKKMVESIEELVKKTPLDAAALMNRWLNVER
ncbi:MAG TPA: flagellar M-ring protein FliF C-terminal domain-containing protein [Phycisphaerales bacterium]|nr:flagellar M-ring protein FliF C-terminal domain-containing protein [Phycisphaerales bacterium]